MNRGGAVVFVVALLTAAAVTGGLVATSGLVGGPEAAAHTPAASWVARMPSSTPTQPRPGRTPTATSRREVGSRARTAGPARHPLLPRAHVSAPPGTVSYVFPIAGCAVSHGAAHHDYPAVDIFAARGCAVVAPVAGRVDEVTWSDRWSSASNRGEDRGGRSVSVVGVDGVRYYGSHLESVAAGIRPGVVVVAGQRLGTVGDSGSARGTGTHLHFGISWPTGPGLWWVRRGMVAPQPYVDAWRAGHDLSPAPAVAAMRRRVGDHPRCTSYC